MRHGHFPLTIERLGTTTAKLRARKQGLALQ